MKRKNLFLSLISSVLVAVAIITVTIVSVIKPNTKPKGDKGNQGDNISIVTDDEKYDIENNFNRNGSEEYPYIIYSADSFKNLISKFGGEKRVITKPATETVEIDGVQTEVLKKDSEGHLIFERVLDADGKEIYGVYNFVFARDVDFSETEYVTLFNAGKPFIGNIDAKGFALKNVSIGVTTENLMTKFSFINANKRYARIALFGEIEGSVIKNMKVESLNVSVASDVFAYINDAQYAYADGQFAELVVAGIAGVAKNATISSVSLDARISGSSYALKNEGNALIADNAMGGVVAVAENLTVDSSKVSVSISANAGSEYLIGGVAAYGRIAKVSNSEIAVAIDASYSQRLTMAGMFAYARALEATDCSVNFVLNETASQEARNAYVNELTNGNTTLAQAGKMSTAAGIACVIRANNSTQKTIISNVTVKSNVDFDCIFAGAILDTYSTSPTTKDLITLTDIIVDANAKVLALHGFARQLVATTVSYGDAKLAEGYFNIKISGSARLNKYISSVNATETVTRGGATIFTAAEKKYVSYLYKDLFIQVTSDADTCFMNGFDRFSIKTNSFGSYTVIAG